MNADVEKKLQEILDSLDEISDKIMNEDEDEVECELSKKVTITKGQLVDALAVETTKVFSIFNEGPQGMMLAMLLPVFSASVVGRIFNEDKKEEK